MNESASAPSFDPALLQAQAAFARSRYEAKAQAAAASESAGKDPDSAEVRKKRWQASLDFQSMFLGQMLKAMRRTVGQAGGMGGEDSAEKPSMGREIFTEMLDGEYAALASRSGTAAGSSAWEAAANGGGGLAGQIYRSLSRHAGDASASDIKVFQSDRGAAFRLRGAEAFRRASQPMGAPGISRERILPETKLEPLAATAAADTGLSPALIRGVIQVESAGDPLALSAKGAKGLMQLMDGTARDMGVAHAFDPRQNVLGGARYLKSLLSRYDGDERLALAAYNAGPGAVDRHGGIPPYAETRRYVDKVLAAKERYAAEPGDAP